MTPDRRYRTRTSSPRKSRKTTVSLDPDIDAALRQVADDAGTSIGSVLNDAASYYLNSVQSHNVSSSLTSYTSRVETIRDNWSDAITKLAGEEPKEP